MRKLFMQTDFKKEEWTIVKFCIQLFMKIFVYYFLNKEWNIQTQIISTLLAAVLTAFG